MLRCSPVSLDALSLSVYLSVSDTGMAPPASAWRHRPSPAKQQCVSRNKHHLQTPPTFKGRNREGSTPGRQGRQSSASQPPGPPDPAEVNRKLLPEVGDVLVMRCVVSRRVKRNARSLT